MLTRIRQSLITRLMVYFFIAGLLFVVLFGINFAHGLRVHFKQEVLPNIAQYLGYIVQDIGSPPDLDKAERLSHELSLKMRISGPGTDWQSHSQIPRINELELEPAPAPFQEFEISHQRHRNFVVLRAGEYRYLYMIGRPFGRERHQRSIGFIVVVTLSMLVLFWLIRRSLRPLDAIQQGIQRIGQGVLDEPIAARGSSEFKELAQGINTMSEQIDTMLEGKQQMLLAISHELRSPITRARINLELLPDHASKQALIEDCNEMEHLVSQLLESERLNQRHAVLNKSRFSLDELVSETVGQYFPSDQVGLQLQPVELYADRTRCGLLIKNLLDNALKYSSEQDRSPEVRVHQQQAGAVLEVEDFGQGMAQQGLERVTQAFYRIDQARSRDTGGFGLGLYLCDKIVDAHGAQLSITSQVDVGTKVSVVFPLEESKIA